VSEPVRIGVLGLGAFGSRLAAALAEAGCGDRLLLSARGRLSAATAERLSVPRADNRELVECCGVVFLCVRAEQAQACTTGLPWRAGQVVASTCASLPLAPLAGTCAPATVVRALPLPAPAARGCSLLWPGEPRVHALLAATGDVLAVADEDGFAASCAGACLYAWSHQLAAWTADWAAAHGLEPAAARSLVAASLEAAGAHLRATAPVPVAALLASIATPGGLSEAGLRAP
jgi:pyrroline-5-carboxylate reductase